MHTEIIYVDPASPGYRPVSYMANLAAELLEAKLIFLNRDSLTPFQKLGALLPRRREGSSGVLICPSPYDLLAIISIPGWRKRYRRLVAWVFDSFWTEHLPRMLRFSRIFDYVFVTELEDLATWRTVFRAPVDWLPWGSDVLRLGSCNATRPFDLVRLGRQPPTWEDDVSTEAICNSMNLRFQGRPPIIKEPISGQRTLLDVLTQTKFTLSFSNLVSPGPQTHRSRTYITGRWTDALAAGAVVAGVAPRSNTTQALLWKHALLDIGTVDRTEGLQAISAAARNWTSVRAKENYVESLRRLDWRWRFQTLVSVLDIAPQKLADELRFLRETLSDLQLTEPPPANQH